MGFLGRNSQPQEVNDTAAALRPEPGAVQEALAMPGPKPPVPTALGTKTPPDGTLPPTARDTAQQLAQSIEMKQNNPALTPQQIVSEMDARRSAAEQQARTGPEAAKPMGRKKAFWAGALGSLKSGPEFGIQLGQYNRGLANEPVERGDKAAGQFLRAVEASQADRSVNAQISAVDKEIAFKRDALKQEFDIQMQQFQHELATINARGGQDRETLLTEWGQRKEAMNAEFKQRLLGMEQEFKYGLIAKARATGMDLESASALADQRWQQEVASFDMAIPFQQIEQTDQAGVTTRGPAAFISPNMAQQGQQFNREQAESTGKGGNPYLARIKGPVPMDHVNVQVGTNSYQLSDIASQMAEQQKTGQFTTLPTIPDRQFVEGYTQTNGRPPGAKEMKEFKAFQANIDDHNRRVQASSSSRVNTGMPSYKAGVPMEEQYPGYVNQYGE